MNDAMKKRLKNARKLAKVPGNISPMAATFERLLRRKPVSAMTGFGWGDGRVSSSIERLRAEGWDIETIETKTASGKKFGRYVLCNRVKL